MTAARNPSEQWPKHHMGKHTGYEENQDGTFSLAPTHRDEMERLNAEQLGIDMLLKAVVEHCHRLSANVALQREVWWRRVRDDLGDQFRHAASLEYSSQTNRLRIIAKPGPKKKAPSGRR